MTPWTWCLKKDDFRPIPSFKRDSSSGENRNEVKRGPLPNITHATACYRLRDPPHQRVSGKGAKAAAACMDAQVSNGTRDSNQSRVKHREGLHPCLVPALPPPRHLSYLNSSALPSSSPSYTVAVTHSLPLQLCNTGTNRQPQIIPTAHGGHCVVGVRHRQQGLPNGAEVRHRRRRPPTSSSSSSGRTPP